MSTPFRHSTAVQQLLHNTTSWLGHRTTDHKEIITGQTFIAPAEGDLDAIEVFSSVVANPGQVEMTLYSFDTHTQSWGAALGSAKVNFTSSLNNQWVAFKLPGLHLQKGMGYGFKLASQDCYIGVGEAAGSAKHPPFSTGKEWKFASTHSRQDAHAYSYFSLAFKVDLKAA